VKYIKLFEANLTEISPLFYWKKYGDKIGRKNVAIYLTMLLSGKVVRFLTDGQQQMEGILDKIEIHGSNFYVFIFSPYPLLKKCHLRSSIHTNDEIEWFDIEMMLQANKYNL